MYGSAYVLRHPASRCTYRSSITCTSVRTVSYQSSFPGMCEASIGRHSVKHNFLQRIWLLPEQLWLALDRPHIIGRRNWPLWEYADSPCVTLEMTLWNPWLFFQMCVPLYTCAVCLATVYVDLWSLHKLHISESSFSYPPSGGLVKSVSKFGICLKNSKVSTRDSIMNAMWYLSIAGSRHPDL